MSNTDWEKESKVKLVTSCKQAARLVSISTERRLTFREYLSMAIHLSMCKTCTFYKRQIAALRTIFIRHQEVLDNTPPAENERLTEDARRRINDAIGKRK